MSEIKINAMKKIILFKFPVLLFLATMVLFTCNKEDLDLTTKSAAISSGSFQGLTSKNQDVYLHINEESEIDSIAVKIRVNFVTFYCTYTFYSKTDTPVEKEVQFEIQLTNPSIFICGSSSYPILKGTFSDVNNCAGIITAFMQCGGYCGSSITFSSGSTVSEQTWTVLRE